MNISRIRSMASGGDLSVNALRYLIECHGECEHLDFKESIDLSNDYGIASFSKDVVGMKNIGGGYIVVGVQDKTWLPLGISLSLPYDTKMVRDKVRKSTGLDIDVDIVQHELYTNGSPKLFGLFLVRSTTKRSKLRVPTFIRTNFCSSEKWGLRQGEIYIRSGDSTKRMDSEEELQDLLDDLEARHQEGEIESEKITPSPFAVNSGLFRLLPKEYATFVGREKYKSEIRKAIEGDPRIWIINLYGPGGVGKSVLATWAAYEYYNEKKTFEAILQLSAKDLELSTEEGIRHLNPTLFSLDDFIHRVLHLFEHGEYFGADLEKSKQVVIEILSAYRTLLILDNMETVTDGRIMEFIRSLPPSSQAKVLLTSRKRTSDWEYPVRIIEFDQEEVKEFVKVRNLEMSLDLPYDDDQFIEKMSVMSGGLPLAIQWTMGEYAKTRDLEKILRRALSSDSPLLEFSFRNSWLSLGDASQKALAVLSIFDSPPTLHEWRTAIDWPVEKLEEAIASLIEVTFVSDHVEQRTGKTIYIALPITLTFARNELAKMSGFEARARLRYQEYKNRMELGGIETKQYEDLFSKFGAQTETQKRAIILCRMAEGHARSLGYQTASQYYKQALEVDPKSVYSLVSYGLFRLELENFGEAIDLFNQAAKICTKKTGYYIYFNFAKVYEATRDRQNRIKCLRKALEYEPKHTIARHSLGVALSQSGNYDEALNIFDEIIREEVSRPEGPSESLAYAYKTKIITLRNAKRDISAREALKEARSEIVKHRELAHLANSLEDVLD